MLQKHNYNHLFYFWKCANAGSLKKASEQLFISTSTLCDQIKTLESRIGHPLFTKKGKLLHLTTKGHSLYQLVNGFFSTFITEAELLFSFNKQQKSITIGVSNTISSALVSEVIKTIMQKEHTYPIVFHLPHDELYKRAINQELDVIISDDDNYPESGNINFQKYKLRKFCVVNSGIPHSREKKFPQNLDRIPFISYTKGHYLHQKTLEFIRDNKINPMFICEIDNIDLIIKLTCEKQGASILPYLSVKELIANGKLTLLGELNNFSPYLFVGFSKKTFDANFMDSAFASIKHLQLYQN